MEVTAATARAAKAVASTENPARILPKGATRMRRSIIDTRAWSVQSDLDLEAKTFMRSVLRILSVGTKSAETAMN